VAIERYTRTVTDILTSVKRQFGDESSVQINDADIIRWVNDGQREIVDTNTTINQKLAKTDVIANQDSYPLSTDANLTNISRITSVRFNNSLLRPITVQEAENYAIGDGNTGDPTAWFEEEGNLILYPKPTTGYVQGLTFRFTALPTKVTTNTDALTIPDSYYSALVQYCLSQAYELDENAQMAQMKSQQFEKTLGLHSNRTVTQNSDFPTIRLDLEDSF
jgi:hypothetical protein